jgi:uncharacterized protein YggT (Ycf19 family)
MAYIRTYQERTTTEPTASEPRGAFTVYSVVTYIVNVIEVLLAARLLLRLFSANPAAPFVDFVYRLTQPLVAPFRGIFANSNLNRIFVEWSVVVAMVIYALIGYAVIKLIQTLVRRY